MDNGFAFVVGINAALRTNLRASRLRHFRPVNR